MVLQTFWRAARWPIVAIMCVLTVVVVILGQGINTNTDRLEAAVYQQCVLQNRNSVATNEVIDTIKAAVDRTSSLPAADQTARLELVGNLEKIPMLACPKP